MPVATLKAVRPAPIRNAVGGRMLFIPPGEFLMGNPEPFERMARDFPEYECRRILELVDETPAHKVRITRGFYLAECQVTVGQFAEFLGRSGYEPEPDRDGTGGYGYNPKIGDFEGRDVRYSWRDAGFPQEHDHPVVNITWADAVAFCDWLSRVEGRTYRLPTEAEWEYACRAGTTTRYCSGDDPQSLDGYANLYDADAATVLPSWQRFSLPSADGFRFTSPAGVFKANAFGLRDMHGNVWEWCSDWYAKDYYAHSPVDDPQGPEDGEEKVRRGGGWHTWPLYVRSAYRNYNTVESRYVGLGMRVAMSVE
jgi:formylglycine-generating enzyme required for sulfatase activity